MLWSYDKPTKEGVYFVNIGDVVTEITFEVVSLESFDGELYVDGDLSKPISKWNSSIKFMPVDFEALNKIGNESERLGSSTD